MSGQGDPAVGGRGSPGGLAVAGWQLSPRPSDASPTARRAAAHGTPGDRPPAVPAVSRCRARQHHGRAVTLAPVRRSPGECHSDGAGMPRIVRAGPSSLNGASHPRYARTRLRRAVDPGDLCQPSGPDGEGQAEGQARDARSEPPQLGTAIRRTVVESSNSQLTGR
jgi:hypothetical protein